MSKIVDKFMRGMKKVKTVDQPISIEKVDKLIKSKKLDIDRDFNRVYVRIDKGSLTFVGTLKDNFIIPNTNFKCYVEPLMDEEVISEEKQDKACQEAEEEAMEEERNRGKRKKVEVEEPKQVDNDEFI
jgi:hypothetical protein